MVDWILGLFLSAVWGLVVGASYYRPHAHFVLKMGLAWPEMPLKIPRNTSFILAIVCVWLSHRLLYLLSADFLDSPVIVSAGFYLTSITVTAISFALVSVPLGIRLEEKILNEAIEKTKAQVLENGKKK